MDTPITTPSVPDTATVLTDERRKRRDQLFGAAREATGFMPDDEGEALYLAALRAGGVLRRRPRSSRSGPGAASRRVYLGAAAEATGAVLFSLDHHHGSEENQAGWEHHDTHAGRPRHRADRHPAPLAAHRDRRRARGVGGRHRRRLPHRGVPLVDAAGLLLHRRRPRRRAGLGRLPGLGAARGRRTAGWPSTTCSPTRPTAAGPPTSIWRAALDSGEFVEDGECGSLRIVRRL